MSRSYGAARVAQFPTGELRAVAELLAADYISTVIEASEATAANAALSVLGCLLRPTRVLQAEDQYEAAFRIGREQHDDIYGAAEISVRLDQLMTDWTFADMDRLAARLPNGLTDTGETRVETMRRVEAAVLALRVHPNGAAS